MKIGSIFLSILFLCNSAHAAQQTLVTLTSEAEPSKVATLGVATNPQNEITALYYKGSDGKTKTFPVSELGIKQVFYNKKGHDLVFIRTPYTSPIFLSLSLSYVKSVFDSEEIGQRYFSVKFNAHLNKYEMLDEKQRPINRIYVTSHRNCVGLTVGIDELQTQ